MLTKLFRVSLLLLASHASFTATANITQALQHAARTEENKLPDAARKPEKTLTFFKVIAQIRPQNQA
jgi:predicted methyltransferase